MTYLNLLIGLFLSTSVAASGGALGTQANSLRAPLAQIAENSGTNVPEVPFYSQFRDISADEWKKQGCGIASLAMLIEFYKPGSVSVDVLLKEGIVTGAYLSDAGWIHKKLALLADKYGLDGKTYDLSQSDMSNAFAQFKKILKDGPVIASVFYKFDPKSTIPHLVVVTGIAGDKIYYNDPAGASAGKEISAGDFMKGWKKRFITVRDLNNA